jgi:hypothetical protein
LKRGRNTVEESANMHIITYKKLLKVNVFYGWFYGRVTRVIKCD